MPIQPDQNAMEIWRGILRADAVRWIARGGADAILAEAYDFYHGDTEMLVAIERRMVALAEAE